MKFCSAYYSDIGKKETNQDSLLLMQRRQPQGDEIVFAVICDGVGGLKMGEQASAEVVTAFHDWFNNQIEGLYQQEIPMTALFNDWDKLIQELHGLLKEHSENAGFRSGTTVEAVLLMKNQYYICHIGDCRTYVLSDTIDQLTTDHTVVQREITEGRLTAQQAAKDPRQSLLLQCVGAGKVVKPDYLYGDIKPHQVYTLKPCQGPWTDIYALASTFYFIVSGQKMLDALSRAKGGAYLPLWKLAPAVSKPLSDVMDHALAFDYHDRYRSMMDFLSALEQVVQPEEYDIDLGALMPKSKASGTAVVRPKTAAVHDDSEKVCSVEEQDVQEPRGLAAFFHPKKRKMAYLELTIDYRETAGCFSKRRWLLEPNCTIKIGRSATSDVMMPANNRISRNHCEIFYNEKRKDFTIRDLSKFGTLLSNGEPMKKGKQYTLRDGDSFYVLSPEYKFKVVIET